MSRGPDVALQLERALLASAAAAGCPLELRSSEVSRWASITFSGTRNLLVLTARGSPALDAWLTALPETELELRNHLVADIAMIAVKNDDKLVTMRLEILTVEDWPALRECPLRVRHSIQLREGQPPRHVLRGSAT